MRALCLNCTLKRSPEPSNTESLARVALEADGWQTETIRVVDHVVEPGVVSEAITAADGTRAPARATRSG